MKHQSAAYRTAEERHEALLQDLERAIDELLDDRDDLLDRVRVLEAQIERLQERTRS